MAGSKYSKEIIEKKINEYLEAETALITGGKSYKIGTRELTRMSLEEIRKGRAYWENELDKLERRGKRNVKIGVHRAI